jgi:hypothetical protein
MQDYNHNFQSSRNKNIKLNSRQLNFKTNINRFLI